MTWLSSRGSFGAHPFVVCMPINLFVHFVRGAQFSQFLDSENGANFSIQGASVLPHTIGLFDFWTVASLCSLMDLCFSPDLGFAHQVQIRWGPISHIFQVWSKRWSGCGAFSFPVFVHFIEQNKGSRFWTPYFLSFGFFWNAITTTSHFLYDHMCYPGNWLKVQRQVQPHVLDLWCVGFVCCVLWLCSWEISAFWSRVLNWFRQVFAWCQTPGDASAFGWMEIRTSSGGFRCAHQGMCRLIVLSVSFVCGALLSQLRALENGFNSSIQGASVLHHTIGLVESWTVPTFCSHIDRCLSPDIGSGFAYQWMIEWGSNSHIFQVWSQSGFGRNTSISFWNAITTLSYFLYDHLCYLGQWLKVQRQVQPHALDLWCVGVVCCVLWLCSWKVFALWSRSQNWFRSGLAWCQTPGGARGLGWMKFSSGFWGFHCAHHGVVCRLIVRSAHVVCGAQLTQLLVLENGDNSPISGVRMVHPIIGLFALWNVAPWSSHSDRCFPPDIGFADQWKIGWGSIPTISQVVSKHYSSCCGTSISFWTAITTTFHLLYDHVCYLGNWLRVQRQVQPHVLDLWCVGFVCCVLWLCSRVVFAFWSRLARIVARVQASVPAGEPLRHGPVQQSFTSRKMTCSNPKVVQILILLAFMHAGEAHNPGPRSVPRQPSERKWSLGTFNPSGLGGKHQVIGSYLQDCDVWAVSETHLTSRGFSSFKQNLKRSSHFQYCVGGNPVPLRQHSDKTGEWSGVCMLSKHPTRQLPVKWPSYVCETSRVLLTTTLCADLWITGAVLYGEPPGVTHPDAHHNTDLLAHDLIQQLIPIGGLRFVAGDFNFEKGSLDVFRALEASGFRDLQDLAFEKWGQNIQKTCKRSTRKDFFFISPRTSALSHRSQS